MNQPQRQFTIGFPESRIRDHGQMMETPEYRTTSGGARADFGRDATRGQLWSVAFLLAGASYALMATAAGLSTGRLPSEGDTVADREKETAVAV